MSTELAKDLQNPRLELRNLVLAILISLYGIVLIRTAWVDEDAYITFRTIANFLARQGLVFNPGERVQAFSHPLWLFVMTFVYVLFHNFFYGSIGLSILLSIAAVILLVRRVSISTTGAVLGILILVLSRAFVDYSTSGLENPLSHLLVVLFLVLYFGKTQTIRQLFLLTLIAALGTLNRPDAILFFLPALIHSFWRVRGKQAILAVILGFVPMIIWEAFSLFYYGFPFPNTFYADLNTGIPAADLVRQGVFYLFNSINTDPLTMIAILGGILIAFVHKNLRHIFIALGILLYLVYVLRIGGDTMSGRFLTIPLLAAVGIIVNRQIDAGAEYFVVSAAVFVIGMMVPGPTLTSGADYGTASTVAEHGVGTIYAENGVGTIYAENGVGTIYAENGVGTIYAENGVGSSIYVDHWGISDERAGYYQGSGLLSTTRYLDMPYNQWVQQGLDLQQSGQTVYLTSIIGFTGFYAGRGVHIIDGQGLADALLARLTPRPNAHWLVSQYDRFVPDGYVDTIKSGQNKIANKDLAAYYDKLKLVISGRLTDPRRLVEIWKLNFGAYNNLIQAYQDSLLLHVSLSDAESGSTSSVPRDAGGNIQFPMYGIEIALDQPSHDRHVQITLVDETAYIIVFSKNGQEIGRQIMEGTYTNNFETMTIGVPPNAAKKGYDHILILPSHLIPTYLLRGVKLLP